MAEVLLVREAGRRNAALEAASAGFVTEGRPADPQAVEVMADRGLDLTSHRSRLVDEELVATADLVIGMTREHVRRTFAIDPHSFPRTFTLKELVRRGSEAGPVADGLDDWLERLDEGRERVGLVGQDPHDDVADPIGRPLRRFRACAGEIEAHTITLADLVWPRVEP